MHISLLLTWTSSTKEGDIIKSDKTICPARTPNSFHYNLKNKKKHLKDTSQWNNTIHKDWSCTKLFINHNKSIKCLNAKSRAILKCKITHYSFLKLCRAGRQPGRASLGRAGFRHGPCGPGGQILGAAKSW